VYWETDNRISRAERKHRRHVKKKTEQKPRCGIRAEQNRAESKKVSRETNPEAFKIMPK